MSFKKATKLIKQTNCRKKRKNLSIYDKLTCLLGK